MFHIKKSDYDEIVSYAKNLIPEEACGLIGGHKNGDEFYADKIYYLENIDHSNEHFSLDPKDQLAAAKDMRANNLTLIANFHSHPESPSRPSEEDKKLAYDTNIKYLILSLAENEPVLNAFIIDKEKNVSKLPIEIY